MFSGVLDLSPFDTPFDCGGTALLPSAVLDRAGAFPDGVEDTFGLEFSVFSTEWETLAPLGAALDWLKAGDFVWALDGVSVVGTLDLVTGVWLTLAV